MQAYKFLAPGGVGPFSRFAWPTGTWVRAGAGGDGPELCRRGIHACRLEHLPWWIQAELWEVELEEPARLVRHKLVAPAGRLVRRIDAWDADCAVAFARSCAARVSDPAILPDAQASAEAGDAAVAGYIAAVGALRAEGRPAMDAERARQAAWLAERLGL